MISAEKPTDKPDLKREAPGANVEETERPKEVRKADLHSGDRVQVRTAHSTYSILVLENGIYSVSGGWFDHQGLSPMETTITVCRRGRAINPDLMAASGLQLEFGNGVVTSSIRELDVTRIGEHYS